MKKIRNLILCLFAIIPICFFGCKKEINNVECNNLHFYFTYDTKSFDKVNNYGSVADGAAISTTDSFITYYFQITNNSEYNKDIYARDFNLSGISGSNSRLTAVSLEINNSETSSYTISPKNTVSVGIVCYKLKNSAEYLRYQTTNIAYLK